jgi:hypothetical protein
MISGKKLTTLVVATLLFLMNSGLCQSVVAKTDEEKAAETQEKKAKSKVKAAAKKKKKRVRSFRRNRSSEQTPVTDISTRVIFACPSSFERTGYEETHPPRSRR